MSGLLSSVVSLSITRDSLGVQQAGFGVPLIVGHSATFVERLRFYASVDEVFVDFAATTPEYLMSVAIFSQNPKPERIAIGRAALKPTQKYTLTPTVANSTAYKLYIDGEDYSYTSDASATDTEIVDELATLINADTGTHGFVATTPGSPGSETLVLTANTAGAWGAVEVDNIALLAIVQDHADPGLATDLAAIAVEDDSWYFILYPWNSKACAIVLATYAEANKKLYICQTSDSNNATLAIGSDSTTSTMGQFKTSAYDRSAPMYHPDPAEFSDAAWVGRNAPKEPGSETWGLNTLAGVDAVDLTSTHRTNIEAKNGNHYESIAGVNVTQPGKVASGEFIDVIRGIDWLEARMAEAIFSHLAADNKVPFTDRGIAVVEADIRSVLQQGVDANLLTDDPAFVVTVPKASAVPSADKAARRLTGVKFNATLAGAIHKVTINGTVSV